MTDSTDRAIGRLEGKMEEVIRLLAESSASRAKLYEGMERVQADVVAINGRMQAVESAVHVMDPLVKEFGRIKERWRGIALVLGVIWLILGGLILQGITWIGGWLWKAVGGGS